MKYGKDRWDLVWQPDPRENMKSPNQVGDFKADCTEYSPVEKM